MDPSRPETLYAAAYQVRRPREGGPGAQRGFGPRPMVAPGEYKVKIAVGDPEQERSLKVEAEAE